MPEKKTKKECSVWTLSNLKTSSCLLPFKTLEPPSSNDQFVFFTIEWKTMLNSSKLFVHQALNILLTHPWQPFLFYFCHLEATGHTWFPFRAITSWLLSSLEIVWSDYHHFCFRSSTVSFCYPNLLHFIPNLTKKCLGVERRHHKASFQLKKKENCTQSLKAEKWAILTGT